jgi:hypothetical protein
MPYARTGIVGASLVGQSDMLAKAPLHSSKLTFESVFTPTFFVDLSEKPSTSFMHVYSTTLYETSLG